MKVYKGKGHNRQKDARAPGHESKRLKGHKGKRAQSVILL